MPNISLQNLHPSQQKLYEILAKQGQNDFTLRELADLIDVSSPSTVEHHIQQLEKKGYIFRDKDTGRIEALKDPVRDIVYLNLYGVAECGPTGFFAEDNIIEKIPLPAKALKLSNQSFLVEAKNDSMEPNIHSGDLVLVEKSSDIKNSGDIAVIIHEDQAKIKKLYWEDGHYILQSTNQNYKPIIVSEDESLHIAGLVKGVIHKFNKAAT